MKNVRITAMERLVLEGAYSTISVLGVGNSTGGCVQAEKISVKGMMHFSNQPLIEADVVNCTGNCTMDSALKAGTVDVAGIMKLSGALAAADLRVGGVTEVQEKLHCGSMKIDGVLRAKKIEGESILCDGVLKVQAQISADRVTVGGIVTAEEVVGDYIMIDSRPQSARRGRQWFGIKAFANAEKSRADLIEATTIRLYNVKAARVNGQDVVIGEGCEIGCVDCTGSLQIDPGAYVKSIVNNDKKI